MHPESVTETSPHILLTHRELIHTLNIKPLPVSSHYFLLEKQQVIIFTHYKQSEKAMTLQIS